MKSINIILHVAALTVASAALATSIVALVQAAKK